MGFQLIGFWERPLTTMVGGSWPFFPPILRYFHLLIARLLILSKSGTPKWFDPTTQHSILWVTLGGDWAVGTTGDPASGTARVLFWRWRWAGSWQSWSCLNMMGKPPESRFENHDPLQMTFLGCTQVSDTPDSGFGSATCIICVPRSVFKMYMFNKTK